MSNENDKAIAIKDFDPFDVMDQLDDKAILAEIEGQIIDKWAYHFEQEGKEVWGISKVGVDQACREMAKQGEAVREEDVIWEVDPTDSLFVLFKAKASRVILSKEGLEISLDRAFGTKRQCIFVVKGGAVTDKTNPFWFEQGSIKALRNARSRLISEEVRSKIIALAKSMGKVQTVSPEQAEAAGPSEHEQIFADLNTMLKDVKTLDELKDWWIKNQPVIKNLPQNLVNNLTAMKDQKKEELSK